MSSNLQEEQSSVASAPNIWFLLLDTATGHSFKGTSADAVALPTGSLILHFRDAVRAKYDLPNYLKGISSSALLVYKNKGAFDKRNAESRKTRPLDVDSLVHGLGKSMKKALIVVVPSFTG